MMNRSFPLDVPRERDILSRHSFLPAPEWPQKSSYCGGTCVGTYYGSCVNKKFSCLPGSNRTGPSCLARGSYDDDVWEILDTWDDLEFQGT